MREEKRACPKEKRLLNTRKKSQSTLLKTPLPINNRGPKTKGLLTPLAKTKGVE
jgi:hypothetical protein